MTQKIDHAGLRSAKMISWTLRHSDPGGDVPFREVAKLERHLRRIIRSRDKDPLFDLITTIECAAEELRR